jgi:hypothetical protein
MKEDPRKQLQTIIDLETLNTLNGKGCPACGKGFTLGEPVVAACGSWGMDARLIHLQDAVYDRDRRSYVEKGCATAS